jgi:hypothetical protein
MLQESRSNGGQHGVVMTKKLVVEAMLDLCGYRETADLSDLRLLDPAGGDGIFILTALDRLHKSSIRHHFSFSDKLRNLKVIEVNEQRASSLTRTIQDKLKKLGLRQIEGVSLVTQGDFLTANLDFFDIIVGNPPYIRYDNLSLRMRKFYRHSFKLFRNRSDIYIAFFDRAFGLLSKRGVVCFITPDRWLRNQYGESLRDYISKHLGIPVVLNLDGTNPFEEEVYGYPMITLITKRQTEFTQYSEVRDLDKLKHTLEIISGELSPLCSRSDVVIFPTPQVGEIWSFNQNESTIPSRGFLAIESQGFKIGIGVATGKDSIYIGKNLREEVEDQLLLPIVLSKDIVNGEVKWSGNYLLNPYDRSGNLIDLNQYPHAKRYLTKNRDSLVRRHVARKNRKEWFRTIDKIHPQLLTKPKLLLPDIKKGNLIAFDGGRYYPHHNIYYVTDDTQNTEQRLKVLGALMMSDIFVSQLNSQSVKMHGGFVRRQAQNLRRIFLPDVRLLSERTKNELSAMFDNKDPDGINRLLEARSQELTSKSALELVR